MAKIKYILTPFGLEKLQGKYQGIPLSNGLLGLEEVSAMISEDRPALDVADANLIIEALAREIERYVSQGMTVQTPFGWFAPVITGSVPSMDAPLGEDNQIVTGFTIKAGFAASVANIVPVLDKAADIVRLVNVCGLTSQKVGTIHGTEEAVLTGSGLSASQEGESVVLVAQNGTEIPCGVTEHDDEPQRIYFHATSAGAPGVYKLRLTTRGYGRPDHAPEVYDTKVTLT